MNTPKEKPILFNAPMVRAILDGSKTQTRRIVKAAHLEFIENPTKQLLGGRWDKRPFPFGRPVDHLWVRETWGHDEAFGDTLYRAGHQGDDPLNGWKTSIHMPRWASRIILEITEVRIERLQEITEEDAKAEGAHAVGLDDQGIFRGDEGSGPYRAGFGAEWRHINGAESWDASPWIWAISFRRID
jgi:hypothetical protein